jgi:hypothetical protein
MQYTKNIHHGKKNATIKVAYLLLSVVRFCDSEQITDRKLVRFVHIRRITIIPLIELFLFDGSLFARAITE